MKKVFDLYKKHSPKLRAIATLFPGEIGNTVTAICDGLDAALKNAGGDSAKAVSELAKVQ